MNPIYAGIAAMVAGAAARIVTRPDLLPKTLLGGLLFVGYYGIFLAVLEGLSRGYIGRVWTTQSLTGLRLMGLPAEELLFAAGFGLYWSALYEQFTWQRPVKHNGSAQA